MPDISYHLHALSSLCLWRNTCISGYVQSIIIAREWEMKRMYKDFTSISQLIHFELNILIQTFIYFFFWLHWVFVALHGLSLVAASRGYSAVGFSVRGLLLLWSTGSRSMGFSSCITQAQQLRHTGLVVPRHVKSSCTRIEPVSPALAGRLLSTVLPGKSYMDFFKMHNLNFNHMGFPLYCQVESNKEHNVINGFHMDNSSKIHP